MFHIKKAVLPLLFVIAVFAGTPDKNDFPPSIDKQAWGKIDSMLSYSGLTKKDAGFEKKWASDTLFQLEVVKRMLDNPFELPDTLDSWTRFALKNYDSPEKLVQWAFTRIDAKPPSKITDKIDKRIAQIAEKDKSLEEVPEPYRSALKNLLASFDIASEYTTSMMRRIPAASRDSLLYLIPTFWTDSEDTLDDSLATFLLNMVASDFDTSYEVSLDSLYETMSRFDLVDLGTATYAVMLGIGRARGFVEKAPTLPAPEAKIEDLRLRLRHCPRLRRRSRS